jgi:hypothetical protein
MNVGEFWVHKKDPFTIFLEKYEGEDMWKISHVDSPLSEEQREKRRYSDMASLMAGCEAQYMHGKFIYDYFVKATDEL